MKATIPTKSYLLECLEKLPISTRILSKLGLRDLVALEQQIVSALDEGARKLGFSESTTLSIWLEGLKAFGLQALETNFPGSSSRVACSKEESGAIKLLFQELFQSLFRVLGQRVDLLKLLFSAIDQWQRTYNQESATGVRLGLDIRITVPEPNPFAKENERHYLLLTELLWALEQKRIPKIEWQKLSPMQQFGGFLFFAITQSGITQMDKLNQLTYLALTRKKMDEPFSGFLFFSDRTKFGAMPYQSQILEGKTINDTQSTYRWIPDPITKRIYERYRRNWDSLSTVWKKYDVYVASFIKEFLQALLTKIPESPKPQKNMQHARLEKIIGELSHLPTLFKASRAYQRRTLPSFIWHYLENTYQTKDLEPSSIERLHEFKYERASLTSGRPLHSTFLARTAKPVRNNDPDHPALISESEEDIRPQVQIDWCTDLVTIFDSNCTADEKTIAIDQLRSTFKGEDLPLINTLSNWLIEELARNTDQATLRNYASLFLPALIAQYDLEEDFSDFDETERDEEIEELIAENVENNHDDGVDDHSALFRAAWHALHLYLLNFKLITSEQYPLKKAPGRKVDAQYISEREYRAIQTYLWTKAMPMRLKNQCLLILTLAYRFGLRRSEVIKLAVSHVSFAKDAPDQLLLRWWSQRRLKSPSAKRSLPIKGVLTEQEYGWLHLMTLTRRMGSWLDIDLFSMAPLALQEHILKTQTQYQSQSQSQKTLNHLHTLQESPKEEFLLIDDGKSVNSRALEIVDILHEAMRTTVGNHRLRLHHLRHSCAMNTLMLLLSPKLKQSKPLLLSMYYGNEQAIRKFISSLDSSTQLLFNQYIFNGELFESRSHLMRMALLNDQHSSSSEVYITSRLLGHSSPRTTFASYIHALSLLTCAFLYERYEGYSKDLQVALYPNHPRTLTRNQNAVAKGKQPSLLHRQKLGRPFK